jgi:hypothetical protein
MYCKKCGTELQDDAIYCSKCGVVQQSTKLEYKTSYYRKNKKKMLEDVKKLKAEGWRVLTCMQIKAPLAGVIGILTYGAYQVTFERGVASTPKEIRQKKRMHRSVGSSYNKADKLEEWLAEWESNQP